MVVNSGSGEVDPVVAAWQPAQRIDDAVAVVVLPLARSWVTATCPNNAYDARRLLRAVTGMLVWAHTNIGDLDAATVLRPRNVELWVTHTRTGRSLVWCQTTRGALRRVGRAINPDAWPSTTPQTFDRRR